MVERLKLSSTSLKVSKPGFNVNTAAPEDLALDLNQSIFIWYTAVYSRPSSSVTLQTVTYPALPYVPCFNYQYLISGNWSQGHGYFLPPVRNFTTNSFIIDWQTNITMVRVNIFTIEGQA